MDFNSNNSVCVKVAQRTGYSLPQTVVKRDIVPIVSPRIHAFTAFRIRQWELDRAARATGGSVMTTTPHPRPSNSANTTSKSAINWYASSMVLACEKKKNENGSVDAEILSIPLAQRQNCICCAYQTQVVGADHQDDPGLHVAEVSQATNQPPRTATRYKRWALWVRKKIQAVSNTQSLHTY